MDAQALLALRLAGSAEANVVVGPVLAKGSNRQSETPKIPTALTVEGRRTSDNQRIASWVDRHVVCDRSAGDDRPEQLLRRGLPRSGSVPPLRDLRGGLNDGGGQFERPGHCQRLVAVDSADVNARRLDLGLAAFRQVV